MDIYNIKVLDICRFRVWYSSGFATPKIEISSPLHMPRNFNNPYTRKAGQRIALMTPRTPPSRLVAVVR
jgi:hypothetical protein